MEEETILNLIDKLKITQYNKSLQEDNNISIQLVNNILRTASILDLYLKIKGKKECSIIGIKSKESLMMILLNISKKEKLLLKGITNKRSFLRKVKNYKEAKKKSYYDGLLYLIPKNLKNQNSRKVTKEHIEFIKDYHKSNPDNSYKNCFEDLNKKFNDISFSSSSVAAYFRIIEIEDFNTLLKQ